MTERMMTHPLVVLQTDLYVAVVCCDFCSAAAVCRRSDPSTRAVDRFQRTVSSVVNWFCGAALCYMNWRLSHRSGAMAALRHPVCMALCGI